MILPRTLLLSPRAENDLEEIADYLAREAPDRAFSFIDELEAKCAAVALSPEIYPARPELGVALRMAVHGRYVVLFRDLADEGIVRIERVLHGARNLPPLL